jgi:glycosyltransferase involved in cell wall biosynthesis
VSTDGSLEVALLNFAFWPEVYRGSERIIRDLATGLVASGHRPTLITSHRGRPQSDVEDGLRVIRNWRPPDAPLRIRNFQEHLTHLPFSYASLRSGRFDAANAFFPSDGLAAVRWGRRTQRPVVMSYTGIPQRNVVSNKRLRMKTFERTTRESDAVVVVSRAARDGMWRWLGVESRVIYPDVDLETFRPGGQRSEHPTIVCAAAIDDPRKRTDLLVRAFSRVRQEHRRARLLLWSCGRPELERELAAVSDGIEFLPREMRDIAGVFRSAWASGLASYNEAFGIVLLESLACGTPVFAHRDGGPAEIIDSEDIGRLFDGDDEEALARAMLETLELQGDPGTADACRARSKAFEAGTASAAYEQLYRDLLGR